MRQNSLLHSVASQRSQLAPCVRKLEPSVARGTGDGYCLRECVSAR